MTQCSVRYLGSCRIAGPLRILADRGSIALQTRRNFGYVHSAPEVKQLFDFMEGASPPAETTWPLIGPNFNFDNLDADQSNPTDLTIVELSSAKTYWLDGCPVQSNYLQSHFQDRIKNEHWQDFRSALSNFNLKSFIDRHEAVLSPADIGILKKLRMTRTTDRELQTILDALKAKSKRLIIVPHINAVTDQNQYLTPRNAFRELVLHAAKDLALEDFDPTDLMNDVGQSVSIDQSSTGYAHFTDAFSGLWANDFAERFLGQKTENTSPLTDLVTTTQALKAANTAEAGLKILTAAKIQALSANQADAVLSKPDADENTAIYVLCNSANLPASILRNALAFIKTLDGLQNIPSKLKQASLKNLDPNLALEWVTSPSPPPVDARKLIEIWKGFLSTQPPLLWRLHQLEHLAKAGPLPIQIIKLEQQNLKHTAKHAADAKDIAILERLCRIDIPGLVLPPELHLYRARLAYFAEDWTTCIEHGLIALKALPENKGGWIRLSRAASALDLPDIESLAQTNLAQIERVPL